MVKKIRFPLVLADGTQARSLDELKEHFDLESVLGHYKSGKLLKWLQDRYIEAEANAVAALDENAPDFQQELCAVFGVEFSGSEVDLEEITRRQERLAKLRQFTDEAEFIQNIDFVAFDQEELADLLDEGCEKIYLCGEKFAIPASVREKSYVGVNSPSVKVSGDMSDWTERGIVFAGCEVENLSGEVQKALPSVVDDDGPVFISEELAGNIFDAIFEDVPDGVRAREIIAETDHYYVIEEDYWKAPLRYLRLEKTTCIFEELPGLFGFSVASKYHKLSRSSDPFGNIDRLYGPKLPKAPTYKYKDILYMQKITDKNDPSIWHLDLHSKTLAKLIDGVKFFCPMLPALTFPCDGQYIPVIKGNKFCVLEIQSADLIKVRNKGQWMDVPYGAVIAGSKVYFTVDETRVGRPNKKIGTFCSFDLERQEFAEVEVTVHQREGSERLLTMHKQFRAANWYEKGYRFDCINGNEVLGLWVQKNQIIMFLNEKQAFIMDISTQPIHAKEFSYYTERRIIIWGNKMVKLGPKEDSSYLSIMDLESCKESEVLKLDIDCTEMFARIGNFAYMYSYHDLGTSFRGYRVSLSAPYDRVPITLNISSTNRDTDFDWKPEPLFGSENR